jgi:hypothetical protein
MSCRSPKCLTYEVPRICPTTETSRPLCVVGTVEHDVIAHAHCSAAPHVGIERKPAAESAADIAKRHCQVNGDQDASWTLSRRRTGQAAADLPPLIRHG